MAQQLCEDRHCKLMYPHAIHTEMPCVAQHWEPGLGPCVGGDCTHNRQAERPATIEEAAQRLEASVLELKVLLGESLEPSLLRLTEAIQRFLEAWGKRRVDEAECEDRWLLGLRPNVEREPHDG